MPLTESGAFGIVWRKLPPHEYLSAKSVAFYKPVNRYSGTLTLLKIAAIAFSLAVGSFRHHPKAAQTLAKFAQAWRTIGASNYAYLHGTVKAGKAGSVGEAVDRTVEIARRLDNRATLERQTAAYFRGLTSKAAAEETDLEDALSATSLEIDFDQP